jgi:hypothetical protein
MIITRFDLNLVIACEYYKPKLSKIDIVRQAYLNYLMISFLNLLNDKQVSKDVNPRI